jgi:hypothetical protein
MDVSLSNAILFEALKVSPEPLDICGLRWLLRNYVSIPEFTEALCCLEIDGLLEPEGVLKSSITESGKAHLAALVATALLAISGEDLGDVSDHLLLEIPEPHEVR